MAILAPNLTAIVGAAVAAQMMALAGGLQELSRMPSCNVQMMGSKRKVQNGMSTAALGVRAGVITQCPVVVSSPGEFKKKAVRLVSAKCTLAARVDASNESPFGDVGNALKEKIEEALAKVMEPPPQKKHKALPVPDEKPKKKRGGKRARAIKEKYAQSEMMKQASRIQFGVQEEEVFGGTDETKGLGSLGKLVHGGRLRVQKKEVKLLNQKARERNGLTSAVKGQHHGLISSVVMNSTTGMVFEVRFRLPPPNLRVQALALCCLGSRRCGLSACAWRGAAAGTKQAKQAKQDAVALTSRVFRAGDGERWHGHSDAAANERHGAESEQQVRAPAAVLRVGSALSGADWAGARAAVAGTLRGRTSSTRRGPRMTRHSCPRRLSRSRSDIASRSDADTRGTA
eukprot:3783289-Rhodomonas_salina.1